jgi:hypothetical protein
MMSRDEAGARGAVSLSTGCAAIRTSECPAAESLAIRDSRRFSENQQRAKTFFFSSREMRVVKISARVSQVINPDLLGLIKYARIGRA